MILYPNAKINIGLNILRKRSDGFHDISSVFHPVMHCFDILEINKSDNFSFSTSGIDIPYGENICVKAWDLFNKTFDIGNVSIHLHKQIPIGAGLGGGSSDASFTLIMLNKLFHLNLSQKQLQGYAKKLGSDCPFFIGNSTSLVTGVGDNFTEIDLDLTKYEIKLYDLGIHVSTKEAYSKITPKNYTNLESIVSDPIESWKDKLKNDFEEPLFLEHPKIRLMKEKLYTEGAIYVSMTGTGSALFSINMLN